jgi:hypothetical protein
VRYELGFNIPEDGILHSHRREHLKSYNNKDDNNNNGLAQCTRCEANVLHVKTPLWIIITSIITILLINYSQKARSLKRSSERAAGPS